MKGETLNPFNEERKDATKTAIESGNAEELKKSGGIHLQKIYAVFEVNMRMSMQEK